MKSQINAIKQLKINVQSNSLYSYLNLILLLIIIAMSLYYYFTVESID